MNFFKLPKAKAKEAFAVVQRAFPRLGEWQMSNNDDGDHFGCTVWGLYAFEDDGATMHYFVAFDASDKGWRGALTIGQHACLWTSADFGDAYLVTTPVLKSLPEAVDALKAGVSRLTVAFLE